MGGGSSPKALFGPQSATSTNVRGESYSRTPRVPSSDKVRWTHPRVNFSVALLGKYPPPPQLKRNVGCLQRGARGAHQTRKKHVTEPELQINSLFVTFLVIRKGQGEVRGITPLNGGHRLMDFLICNLLYNLPSLFSFSSHSHRLGPLWKAE